MDRGSYQTSFIHNSEGHCEDAWRHQCGCIRTSDKLKQILKSFPTTPPPSPSSFDISRNTVPNTCISAYCTGVHQPLPTLVPTEIDTKKEVSEPAPAVESPKNNNARSWRIVGDLVQLVQLSVTATALALYYLIYCYMQLVYYTLQSALYFHNADGPMKITIGVVTLTSLVVGFNLLLRMERLIGIF